MKSGVGIDMFTKHADTLEAHFETSLKVILPNITYRTIILQSEDEH